MNGAYISKLMELAEADHDVMHLLADSGTGYDEMFRLNFPDQIYNFGIAEEGMVAAAAGMATVGKKPYVFSSGSFLAYRSMEFIRDDVCFQNLNVKLIGMGCGLSWSSLGPTHHTTEEIGVLRSIPNLRILSPATPMEVRACVQTAYEYEGPVYIRIGMNKEPEFFDDTHSVSFGKNEIMSRGKDVMIISTGSILSEVRSAAEKLNADGIETGIINAVSLKPFDRESLAEAASQAKAIVTVEEHNVIGGLASIVADTLIDSDVSARLIRIGLEDAFAEGYGTLDIVRRRNKLDADSIYDRIRSEMRQ